MERLNFSIDFKNLNDPDASEESLDNIKTIIKFLQNANPNYYLIGNMLDEQLNKQLNKQEQTNTDNILPETITKSKLYEKAQERFATWAHMYASASVTAQQMYEDMVCSVFSGDPEYDFKNIDKQQDKNPWEQEYYKRFKVPAPEIFDAFLKTWKQDPVDMYREACNLFKLSLTDDTKDWIDWCIDNDPWS